MGNKVEPLYFNVATYQKDGGFTIRLKETHSDGTYQFRETYTDLADNVVLPKNLKKETTYPCAVNDKKVIVIIDEDQEVVKKAITDSRKEA